MPDNSLAQARKIYSIPGNDKSNVPMLEQVLQQQKHGLIDHGTKKLLGGRLLSS